MKYNRTENAFYAMPVIARSDRVRHIYSRGSKQFRDTKHYHDRFLHKNAKVIDDVATSCKNQIFCLFPLRSF